MIRQDWLDIIEIMQSVLNQLDDIEHVIKNNADEPIKVCMQDAIEKNNDLNMKLNALRERILRDYD